MSNAEEIEAFRRRLQSHLAKRYMNVVELEEEEVGHQKLEKDKNTLPSANQRFSAFTFQNILWLIASICVFHLSEFHLVVLYDPRINRLWFNVGVALIAITLLIAVFLILWVSMIKKVHADSWEQHYPAAIPVATAAFIFGCMCLMKGLWPVWGLLTPIILFTIFMGFVVLIAMFG